MVVDTVEDHIRAIGGELKEANLMKDDLRRFARIVAFKVHDDIRRTQLHRADRAVTKVWI